MTERIELEIDQSPTSTMFRFGFLATVAVVLRTEYLVADYILKNKYRDWNGNKRRIFAVRVVSFTHAFLTALGCLLSLLVDSRFIAEPYDYRRDAAQYVFLFSMGYFIYDLIDMAIHGEASQSKEYFVHHTLVIVGFGIILWTGKLFGFAMIALLVEIQTVFLHLRTMCRLVTGGGKQGAFYAGLVNANMVCMFLFRHSPISYLLHFLLFADDKVPIVLKTFLTGALCFLTYHNIHLTRSMAKADGFFGNEMQVLDDDHIDPLGSVKKESGKAK